MLAKSLISCSAVCLLLAACSSAPGLSGGAPATMGSVATSAASHDTSATASPQDLTRLRHNDAAPAHDGAAISGSAATSADAPRFAAEIAEAPADVEVHEGEQGLTAEQESLRRELIDRGELEEGEPLPTN